MTWSDLKSFFAARNGGVVELESAIKKEYNLASTTATISGRSAMTMALQKSRRVTGGTQVLLPSFTCPVLYETILAAGLNPVPVDVDIKTGNIDEKALRETLRREASSLLDNLAAVIVVHLFGCPVDVESIASIIANEGGSAHVRIIEDCAQALGAPGVGVSGDYVTFSFGIGKVVTGGLGGMLGVGSEITESIGRPRRPGLSESTTVLGNLLAMKAAQGGKAYGIIMKSVYDQNSSQDAKMIARISHRLASEIPFVEMPKSAARVALSQFNRLGEIIARRKSNGLYMMGLLRGIDGLTFPEQQEQARSIFTRFVAYAPNRPVRDCIVASCMRNGIHAEAPYLALEKALIRMGPVSTAMLDRTFTLPVHHRVSDSQLERMADTVKECLGHRAGTFCGGLTGPPSL